MQHVYRTILTFCLCVIISLLLVSGITEQVAAQSYPSDRDLLTFPEEADLYMAYHPDSDQAVLLVPAEGVPVIIFEMTPFEQIHQGLIDPSAWQTVDSIALLPGDTAVLRTSAGGLYKLAFTLTSGEDVPRIQVQYSPVPPTLPDPSAPTSIILQFYEALDMESGDTMTDSTVVSVIFCDDETPPPTPTPDPGVIPEPSTGLLLILGILGLLAAGFLARRNRTACVPACESRRKKGKWWLILLLLSLAVLSVVGAKYIIAQQSCTLFIEKSGDGSGRVIGRGIDCGDVCSIDPLLGGAGVGPGDVLNLKAIPDEGSEFVEWRVNNQPYQSIFRMSGDTVLTAVFEPVVTPPVAAFNANPSSGVAPLSVVFTNSSTGDISSYVWDFGDGATSGEENPSHIYESAGTYTVSLTVSGPNGSNTLTQPDYIEVLPTNQTPVVTITSPQEDAVVASGTVQVSGTVFDDGTIVSVFVNDIPATLIGDTFSAAIDFESGNHVITVAAEDNAGAVGLASCMVRVDGEGPMIGIQSPKRGQSVYTLTPTIAISYSDFYAAVDTSSLSVVLVDEHGATTDVTGDLTISDTQAQGTLSTPLTEDTKYTLNVSIADTLGNVTQTATLFYIPIDPESIVPPNIPENAGWVSGVVYDSTNCNEHLTTCQGLAGARVTLSYAEDPSDTIPGTIVTGPDGFFAFPLPETDVYWLRVEKDGYTYGQREVEVVREHSTATDEIYLTPLDPAVTYCDDTGCSHTSSDGILQIEIPAGAIASGQLVEVTATNFRNVEFLPSGGLPEGTWETYAFNLGGDSEVTFLQPITVKLQNYRGFSPGEEIPLGYWNQETQAWEHEGFSIVDATGDWVVMTVTHFSNYDCNYTVLVPPVGDPPGRPEDDTNGNGSGPCSEGQGKCFIDFKSGTFKEDYTLPSVNVLGQDVAPRLLYSSRRANPSAVIDLKFTVDSQASMLDYVEFELYIEGRKTENFVFSRTPGAEQRYRYFWDGRDVFGKRLPPGVYEYRVKLSVPYRAQYYRAYRFGGKLNPAYPTGKYVDATYDYWTRGTIELDYQPDSPLGAGWVLAGQQRLNQDEAGRILISDGERNDEFYHPYKDFLSNLTEPLGDAAVIPVEYEATGYVVQALNKRDLRYYSHPGGWNHRQYIYLAEDQYIVLDPYCVYTEAELLQLYADNPGVYPEFPMTDWFNFVGDAGTSPMSSRQWACYYPNPANIEGMMYVGSIGYAPTSNPSYIYTYTLANEYFADRQVITFTVLTPNYVEPNVYKLTVHSSAPVIVNLSDNVDNPDEVHIIGPGEEVTLQRSGHVHSPGYRWFVDLSAFSPSNTAPTSRSETDNSWLEYDPDTTTYTRIYPNGTRVHFNPDGTHDYTLDRHGNKTSYTYNPDGTTATMAITPAGENASRWAWDFSYQDGKLAEITDPAGRTTTFDIDGDNHLTAITGPGGATRGYTYDSRGLMTHETDENGNVSEHVYDKYGRITKVLELPRPVYDPVSGQTSVKQEVLTFNPADTNTPFINDSPVGDPDNPAPPVPTSTDLAASVEYGRGGISGHTDKWGRWLDKTDALGRTTTYQRDEAGNLLQRTYPDGSCDEYTYDGNKNLLSKSQMGATQCALAPANRDPAQVQTTLYTYEERFDRIKTKTDPLGHTTTYIYDYEEGLSEVGNLVRIEYPQVEDETGTLVTPTVSYTYNAWGQVTSETDARGTVTRYVYTQDTPVPGLLTQVITDDGGIAETTTYTDFDAAGNPGTVIGPGCCGGGQEMHSTYDVLGRVLTKEDALGIITTYEYDEAGNLIRRIEDYTADGTTGRNVLTEYTYDPLGNRLSQRTEADGIIYETSNGYDINRKLAGQIDSNGNTTNYIYDDADQLVNMSDPLNNSTTYAYTGKGFLETTTLPNGTVVKPVYDDFGRKVQEIVDEGGLNLTTSYTYDLNGNRLTMADPEGVTTCYAYDALNRLTSETQDCGGLNLTTTYRYDLNGNVVSTTDPRGVVTRSTYDALGRLRSTRNDAEGLNLETTFDYDPAGNLERMTDPRGTVTTYEYDAMNRRITMCEDATGLNLITRYTYDRLGNQNFVTDANGIISLTDYNAFGKPVRSVQDVGGIEAETLYVYDNNLNLIAITDDNGNTTQYTYDERDQRSQIQYADGTTVGYTYTSLGSVDTRTNQAGEQVDFEYDAIERLTSRNYPDGSSQSFSYNAASRLTTAQQTMSGHTTNVSFDYDPLGSVQEHVQTVDGLNWTTAYSYDYTAGTATTTYPSGTQVVKSLDTLSRLSQVQQDGAPVAGYSYNMTAGTITQTHGNGLSTLVETDPVKRVTRLSSVVADYRYGYDNVGNHTYMQRAHKPGAPTDVYTYDNLYQLTGVWYGADAADPAAITTYDHLQAYTLDPVGNWLEVENNGISVNYLPNDGQKLTNPMHRYEQVDGQTLGYDLKGNLLEDGENSYAYDVLNRQISMIGLDSTAEYVYDALGRRVAKIVDGVTTYFVYNAFYQVLEERDGSNQLLARYTYGAGIDAVLTMERGGSTYTYHRDALGSITEVTDTGGSLVERYEYDVYGTASIFDSSGTPLTASAIGNPYLFTARRYDPESGNYYYRARMYSSTLGRFLQMDPLGYVDGMNLYAYVKSSPVNSVDPTGLKNIQGADITEKFCGCEEGFKRTITFAKKMQDFYKKCGEDPENFSGGDVNRCVKALLAREGIKIEQQGSYDLTTGEIKIKPQAGKCGLVKTRYIELHEMSHKEDVEKLKEKYAYDEEAKKKGVYPIEYHIKIRTTEFVAETEVKAYGVVASFLEKVVEELETLCGDDTRCDDEPEPAKSGDK